MERLRRAYVRDISKGGMFVRSRKPQAKGTPVSVVLELPDGSRFPLDGEVVQVRERADGNGGNGVRFVGLDDSRLAVLESYIDACAAGVPQPRIDDDSDISLVNVIEPELERKLSSRISEVARSVPPAATATAAAAQKPPPPDFLMRLDRELRRLERLSSSDPYELLDLLPRARAADVEHVVDQRLGELEVDPSFGRLPAGLQVRLNEIRAKLQLAGQTLLEHEARAALDIRLGLLMPEASDPDLRVAFERVLEERRSNATPTERAEFALAEPFLELARIKRDAGDLHAARSLFRAGLLYDPHNLQIREVIEELRAQLKQRAADSKREEELERAALATTPIARLTLHRVPTSPSPGDPAAAVLEPIDEDESGPLPDPASLFLESQALASASARAEDPEPEPIALTETRAPHSEPAPPAPPAEPAEPTEPVHIADGTPVSGTPPVPLEALEARSLDDDLESVPPRRGWMVGAGVGVAVVGLGVLLWVTKPWGGPGLPADNEANSESELVVGDSGTDPAGSPEPEPKPKTAPELQDDSLPTESAPEDPTPAWDPKSPLAPAREAYAAAQWQKAFDLAKALDRDQSKNNRLRVMAEASCQLGEGPRARKIFRQLVGKNTRGLVRETCDATNVDIDWQGKGKSPGELLRAAEAAQRDGDPAAACKLARESNRQEVNEPALVMLGVCACKDKKPGRAKKLRRFVAGAGRDVINAACGAEGIVLE